MRRREFLGVLGGALVISPQAGWAQQSRAVKIGFLYPGPEVGGNALLATLREVLRANNWPDERVEIVARFDVSSARAAVLAKELVDLKPDVLLPVSVGVVEPVRAATKTIPIVAFDLETDPIASGIAANLARPGGNTTGVFFDFPDFSMKWMELLKETIPKLSRVAVVVHPESPSPQLKGVEAAAKLLNVKLDMFEIHDLADVDGALLAASRGSPDAVLLLSSPPIGVGNNPKIVAEPPARAVPRIKITIPGQKAAVASAALITVPTVWAEVNETPANADTAKSRLRQFFIGSNFRRTATVGRSTTATDCRCREK